MLVNIPQLSGDFDCVVCNDLKLEDKIFHINHSVDDLLFVSSSLSNWILEAINEIEIKGTLLHPLDYKSRGNEDGMYRDLLTFKV